MPHVHLAGGTGGIALPFFAETKKLVLNALKSIFKRKGKAAPVLDPDLWQATYDTLDHAIGQGMGSVAYDKPNFRLTNQLRESAALFSAQKSWLQRKELAAIAASKPGYTITWKEFLEQAKPVIGNYNQRWLRTEYNTAIRAARQASLWKQYEDEAHLYPNLRYMASRAATPREEHKPYYGIVRPINDDFWVNHMPPSAWNCICGVEQTDAAVTPVPANGPKPAPGLDHNGGLTGDLYSKTHNISQAVEKAGPDTVAAVIREAKIRLAQTDRYFFIDTPGGNRIKVHPSYTLTDIDDNMPVALILADAGFEVELPRHILRDGVIQPDFIIDGKVADLKEPGRDRKQLPKDPYKSFKKMIDKADDKGEETVVFWFDRALVNITNQDIVSGIPRSYKHEGRGINEKVKTLILIGTDGKVTTITRQEILDWEFDKLYEVQTTKKTNGHP